MNTDISEHARKSADEFWDDPNHGILGPIKLICHIQRGINLAVESKDRRIAELEAYLTTNEKRFDFAQLQQQLADAKETVQSKDREIERLTAEVIAFEFDENTAKHLLTEANAKLAEAREIQRQLSQESNGWESKFNEIDSVVKGFVLASNDMTAQLSSAQAEIERLKGKISGWEQRFISEVAENEVNPNQIRP